MVGRRLLGRGSRSDFICSCYESPAPQGSELPHDPFRVIARFPNECWQGDIAHWALLDGTEVDILDFIDDHSPVIVAADVFSSAKAQDVTASFYKACTTWGVPAAVLTDNGAVFNARDRNGRTTLESELIKIGVEYRHSRPYHPQTCGKIERFHQTLKKYLLKAPRASSISELQDQVSSFVSYYNEIRPHRAKGRRPPLEAYNSLGKARPTPGSPSKYLQVRKQRVD